MDALSKYSGNNSKLSGSKNISPDKFVGQDIMQMKNEEMQLLRE
jgi:hypothetical protein